MRFSGTHGRRLRRGIAVAAVAAVSVALAGCGSSGNGNESTDPDAITIRVGVVPSDTVANTFNQYEFVLGLLEEDTGYEYQLFEATDLAAVIEAGIAGDLDVISLGPFGMLIALQNGAPMKTIGAMAPTSAGPDNAAVAVVRADSPASSLADLEGQDVCFISPSSATGYLFGAAALLDLGIDPESDMNALFGGDHASATRAMYDGECAAVFTYREYAEKVVYDDNPDMEPGALRVLWSVDVPETGIGVSTNLPQEVQDTLRTSILALNGTNVLADGRCPDDRVVTDAENGDFCGVWYNLTWGAVEADDSYWEPIRFVCEATEAPACTS